MIAIGALAGLCALAFAWGYRRGKQAGQVKGFADGFSRGVVVTTDAFARGYRAADEYLAGIDEEPPPGVAEGKPN